jgi:AraC-like DNA-binding protein/quercetin dioxygenase-like cupin family protein
MKKYFNYHVKKLVSVRNLVTLETLEIEKDFSYPEEVHSFHEFAYVDAGAIEVHANGETTLLGQGDLFLISPQQAHFYASVNGQEANVFVACFSCKSEFLEIVKGKNSLDKESRKILADLVNESKNAFLFPFDKKLTLLSQPKFGAQQLIESRIEELFIKLIRGKISDTGAIRFVMNSVEFENNLAGDILELLKENLFEKITLEDIANKTFYSKTYLNNIFKKNVGHSIMQYYNLLKIQEAKRMLKRGVSVTAIADKLNFESANYFTKAFKKQTGLTPSQYKRTITV